MFDGRKMGEEVVATVRDFVGRSISPLSAKLIVLEERINTIPCGPRGEPGPEGQKGEPGKDAEVDIEKAFSAFADAYAKGLDDGS